MLCPGQALTKGLQLDTKSRGLLLERLIAGVGVEVLSHRKPIGLSPRDESLGYNGIVDCAINPGQ